jgi:rhodanese-related sulfurtransferase
MWVAFACVQRRHVPLADLAADRRRRRGESDADAEATLMINREDALVVDVRETGRVGRRPHHRRAPYHAGRSSTSACPSWKSSRDAPIIVVCASGNRSSSACGQLKKRRLRESVYNLSGGISAWRDARPAPHHQILNPEN